MTYTKPEVLMNVAAMDVVLGGKQSSDSENQSGDLTACAYEVDE